LIEIGEVLERWDVGLEEHPVGLEVGRLAVVDAWSLKPSAVGQ
jgi:hypothetical protein